MGRRRKRRGYRTKTKTPHVNVGKKKIKVIEGSLIRRQTSDNIDRWKSRGGKNQGREEKKKEDQRTHVTNFFTLRLTIEKQEGKRKYKSE